MHRCPIHHIFFPSSFHLFIQIWQTPKKETEEILDVEDDEIETTETKCVNGITAALKHVNKVFDIVAKNCAIPKDAIAVIRTTVDDAAALLEKVKQKNEGGEGEDKEGVKETEGRSTSVQREDSDTGSDDVLDDAFYKNCKKFSTPLNVPPTPRPHPPALY